MTIPYAKVPCAECPWRRDVAVGKFPPERFRKLASCAEDLSYKVFACHMSSEGREFGCAGFLLQSSAHNLTIRMAQQPFYDIRSPYPLFDTYRQMAVANGVLPTDPALRYCRDDGARQSPVQRLDPDRPLPWPVQTPETQPSPRIPGSTPPSGRL